MSTFPVDKLSDVDLGGQVCWLVLQQRNPIKMCSCFGDVIRNSRRLNAILIFSLNCGYLFKCPLAYPLKKEKEDKGIRGLSLVILP